MEFRNNDIARLPLDSLALHLSPKGYVAYHLNYPPEESRYSWSKLGFELG